MAKVHVLQGTPEGDCQVAFHLTTPTAGANRAGLTWAEALVQSGLAETIMAVGSGAGQLTQAEADAIAAGTIYEIVETHHLGQDPIASVNAYLDARWTALNGEKGSIVRGACMFFGVTRA